VQTRLRTDRGWFKVLALSFVTCGIYFYVYMAGIQADVNRICSRDGRQTPGYCLTWFLLTPLTAGIAWFVWHHKVCRRISDELLRRGIAYHFDASTFWLWNVLGCFIAIGPWVYIAKLSTAMNLLSHDVNVRG